MTVSISGTSGIVNDATDLNYTGTLTGGTGVVNLGSGQVYKDASGNVGIGTSSPAYKLSLVGAQNATVFGTSTAYGIAGEVYSAFRFENSSFSGGNSEIRNLVNGAASTGSSLAFFTTQTGSGPLTERARIDSSGNLLVGTTSNLGSNGRLNVKQTTAASCANFQNGNDAGWGISFYNVAGGGVGSISWTATTTTYSTSSDYRLKEAIAPMTGALARNALLNPVFYKWKSDGSEGEGFVAHELQGPFPNAVTGKKDAVDADGKPVYQGIGTGPLDGHFAACVNELTQLIQEQQTLITALTARITALETAA